MMAAESSGVLDTASRHLGQFKDGRFIIENCMQKCSRCFMPTDQLDSHKKHLESIEVDYPCAAENVNTACKTASLLTTLACELLGPADSVQNTPAQQTQSLFFDVARCFHRHTNQDIHRNTKQYPQAYQTRISEEAKCPIKQKVEEFCRGIMSTGPRRRVTRQEMWDAWKRAHPEENCDHIFKKLKIDDLYEMPREEHIRHFWNFAVNFLKINPRATQKNVEEAYFFTDDGYQLGRRAGSTYSMFKEGWIKMKDLKNAACDLTPPTSACEGVNEAQAEAVDTGAAQLQSRLVSLVANPGDRISSLDLGAVRAQKRLRCQQSDTFSDLERFTAFGIEKIQENPRISKPELCDLYLKHLESKGIQHTGKIRHFVNHTVTMSLLARYAGCSLSLQVC